MNHAVQSVGNDHPNRFGHMILRLLNASQKCLEVLLIVLTVIMVILVFFQVIFRYVFFYSISWSEEFATFIFVWIVLLGSAVGIRTRQHLGIDTIVQYFPKKTIQILGLVTHFVVILFFFVVLLSSWEVAMANMARRANTVDIPMGYIRMALPIMAFSSIVYGIELEFKLIRHWISGKSEKDKKGTMEV
jgi:TRAP-type C4-dicarboxylate transport system permease small subunit